jgi:hypothetical protein
MPVQRRRGAPVPTPSVRAIAFRLMNLTDWLGAIPEGIWGGIVGVAGAQLLTWVRERRRNRDAYRAPQREAIGAIVAAVNDLKIGVLDALEHLGVGGRQTSDDASAQALNTFQHAMLDLDEKFQIGRLTVVDGPCRDKMLTAYLAYSELRDWANTQAQPTQESFAEFIRRIGETSNRLDTLIPELVDLAEARLSPSRRLLSRRSTIKVTSNKSRDQASK